MLRFLVMLGLAPSESDKELTKLVNNSYDSVQVVGRGTIKIDADEVYRSPEFQIMRAKAKKILYGS
jgi:hypothetical protein